jgi:hypothetical protein
MGGDRTLRRHDTHHNNIQYNDTQHMRLTRDTSA